MSFETVDGTREHTINLVLTDLISTDNHCVTDSFDLSCCAIACRISNDVMHFDMREPALQSIGEKRIAFLPRAFKRFDDRDDWQVVRKQLKRVEKYMRRGFNMDIVTTSE